MSMSIELLAKDGKIEAAEKWLEIAKNKSKDIHQDEVLDDFAKNIEDIKSDKKGQYLFKTLCKSPITIVDEEAFLNSSVSCRFIQEGANPLNIRRVEELSREPEVYLVNDFLSSKEVEFLINGSEDADDWTVENWRTSKGSSGRAAISFFTSEEMDHLKYFVAALKRR